MTGNGDLIIELDRDWRTYEEPPPRPSTLARRRRTIALFLVTLVCLASVGAAQPASGPPLVQLTLMPQPTAADGAFREAVLAGDLLIVRLGPETIAYELDGRIRWRVTPAHEALETSHHYYWMQDDLLLVRLTYIEADNEQLARYTTLALDPLFGKEIWRIDGTVQRVGKYTLVGGKRGTTKVFGAMPSELLWEVPDALASAVDARTGSLLTVTGAGVLNEHDLATGAIRKSAKVDIPRFAAPSGPMPNANELHLVLVADRIILQSFSVGEEYMVRSHSYDRLTFKPTSAPMHHVGHLYQCGPVVCADENGRISILDSSTYARLWQAPEGVSPYWTGAGLLLEDWQNQAKLALVDPYTGAHRVALNGWQPMMSAEQPAAVSLMTRNSPPNGTYVALLRPTGLQILGIVPHQLSNCVIEQDLMMCHVHGGRLGIWQLRTLPYLTSQ